MHNVVPWEGVTEERELCVKWDAHIAGERERYRLA
jgi:hypothetical protein